MGFQTWEKLLFMVGRMPTSMTDLGLLFRTLVWDSSLGLLAPRRGKINPVATGETGHSRQVMAAVTEATQSVRFRTVRIQPAVLGETITWRSNSGVRSKCATRRGGTPPSPPPPSI